MTKDVASFTRDAWGGFQGAEAYLGMLKEIHYNIQPKHFNMTRGYYKGADSFAALENDMADDMAASDDEYDDDEADPIGI